MFSLNIVFAIVFTAYTGTMKLDTFETVEECESFYEVILSELSDNGISIKSHECVENSG